MLDFQQKLKIMQKINLAKKTTYFKKLDEQDFNAIMHCLQGRIQEYHQGDIIVRAGTKVTHAYLILTGEARSYYINKLGMELINLDFSKGHMFGLKDIISQNRDYQEDLKVISDECTVLILDSFRLINPSMNRCKRHIELMKACFYEIGRQNKELEFNKLLLSLPKTSDKVMALLKRISEKKKAKDFTIPYNRNELAIFLGVERSALSYELSKLKKEGKIDYKLNHFTLLD